MDANSDRQLLNERHDRAHIFLFMGARPQKRITYTDRWYKYPKFGSEAFIYNVLNFVFVILTLQLRRDIRHHHPIADRDIQMGGDGAMLQGAEFSKS